MTAIRAETTANDVALLVGRAAGGDGSAWGRLVGQYARLIQAGTSDDFKPGETGAADMAQATWLQLLEHIHGL